MERELAEISLVCQFLISNFVKCRLFINSGNFTVCSRAWIELQRDRQ
jgi:hypothetical protein